MADVQPVGPITLKGWTGGLNREADPFQVVESESPDCLNVAFGLRGDISKRRGYTVKWTHSEVGRKFVDWSGEQVIVEVDGGVVFNDGGTITGTGQALAAETTPETYDIAVGTMNNSLYLTQRASVSPVRWDGTTWTTVTPSDFDDTPNTFPRARVLVDAHDRMFAFNVVESDGTTFHPSRMYYSNPLLPETWSALDWIDFSPDDGEQITGAVLFGEQIVVFKETSMYVLSGTDEETFTVYPIDDNLGTYAPNTIINIGPQLYFFDHLTGVWVYDGSGFKQVDDKINQYLLNGLNDLQIHKATSFAYRGRYFLSVPWGASTVNSRTFVFDARIDAWTEFDYGFSSADLKGAEPLCVGMNNATGVMKMFDGNTDNGADIDAYMYTAWLAPQSPSVKHRIRRMDLTLSAVGTSTLEVNMFRDFASDFYRQQTISQQADGSLYGTAVYGTDQYGGGSEQVLSRTTGWGDRWRVCRFEFANRTDGDFQVNGLTLQTSSLPRTRGEH